MIKTVLDWCICFWNWARIVQARFSARFSTEKVVQHILCCVEHYLENTYFCLSIMHHRRSSLLKVGLHMGAAKGDIFIYTFWIFFYPQGILKIIFRPQETLHKNCNNAPPPKPFTILFTTNLPNQYFIMFTIVKQQASSWVTGWKNFQCCNH